MKAWLNKEGIFHPTFWKFSNSDFFEIFKFLVSSVFGNTADNNTKIILIDNFNP